MRFWLVGHLELWYLERIWLEVFTCTGFTRFWLVGHLKVGPDLIQTAVFIFSGFILRSSLVFSFYLCYDSRFLHLLLYFVEKLDDGLLIRFLFEALLCDSVWNFPFIWISFLCCLFYWFHAKRSTVSFFNRKKKFSFVCIKPFLSELKLKVNTILLDFVY